MKTAIGLRLLGVILGLGLAGCMGTEPDEPKPRLEALGSQGSAFGATLKGTRKQIEFKLLNSDAGFPKVSALKNIAITASGTGTALSHTCPTTLNEGEYCLITVAYQPIVAGALAGELRVTSNAAESPQVLALTGQALDALSPAQGALIFDANPSGDFGSTGSVVTKVFTLHNIGNAEDTFTVTGPTEAGWSFSSTCTDNKLAAGAACSITVEFRPTVTGPSVPSPLVVTDDYNTHYGALTLRLIGVGL